MHPKCSPCIGSTHSMGLRLQSGGRSGPAWPGVPCLCAWLCFSCDGAAPCSRVVEEPYDVHGVEGLLAIGSPAKIGATKGLATAVCFLYCSQVWTTSSGTGKASQMVPCRPFFQRSMKPQYLSVGTSAWLLLCELLWCEWFRRAVVVTLTLDLKAME